MQHRNHGMWDKRAESSFVRKDHLDVATNTGVRVHSILNVPMMLSILIGIAAMIVYQVTVL